MKAANDPAPMPPDQSALRPISCSNFSKTFPTTQLSHAEMEAINTFLEKQVILLQRLREVELHEASENVNRFSPSELQNRGLACTNLNVTRCYTGLGGRTVTVLEPDPSLLKANGLYATGIRIGDIVRLEEQSSPSTRKYKPSQTGEPAVTGVVIMVNERKVSVALDKHEQQIDLTKRMWIVKIYSDAPIKRMIQTITELQAADISNNFFLKAMFSPDLPPREEATGSMTFFDSFLNLHQREAVQSAVQSGYIALIHGPPGTGKTHTIIEIIRQLSSQGLKVLVCGPSNISVDNIAERLAPLGIPMVRIGHPARLLPSVLGSCLDALTQTSDAGKLVQDIRSEMNEKLSLVKKARNSKDRGVIWGDIRDLRKEYKYREMKCTDEIISGSRIVLSTLHGAGGRRVRNEHFDVVIIDEASQALEAECWIPLIRAKKCILAGDHLQLPPTVKIRRNPQSNSDQSLQFTMFDRLLELYGNSIKSLLTVQYRMHEKLMGFPSSTLYESKLTASESVRTRLLSDLPGVSRTGDTEEPLVFWDTQGDLFSEDTQDVQTLDAQKSPMEESKSNEMEADLCCLHLRNLVNAGVPTQDIAVITPYSAQLGLIRNKLKPDFGSVEVGSVDGFQGREKEAVILSLVRSNGQREVGFLSERRRLNVAMTRPRRHLCVIGDSETIRCGSKFLSDWMEFLEESADLRYPDISMI